MVFLLVYRFCASTGTARSSGFKPAMPPPPTELVIGVVTGPPSCSHNRHASNSLVAILTKRSEFPPNCSHCSEN